jgi:hypothetical protein
MAILSYETGFHHSKKIRISLFFFRRATPMPLNPDAGPPGNPKKDGRSGIPDPFVREP